MRRQLGMSFRIFVGASALAVVAATCQTQKAASSVTDRPGTETARTAAEERQKNVLADANQLLIMAQQLKETVDHTRRDELSLQVVRQAADIEKLAKSAKDRIRQ